MTRPNGGSTARGTGDRRRARDGRSRTTIGWASAAPDPSTDQSAMPRLCHSTTIPSTSTAGRARTKTARRIPHRMSMSVDGKSDTLHTDRLSHARGEEDGLHPPPPYLAVPARSSSRFGRKSMSSMHAFTIERLSATSHFVVSAKQSFRPADVNMVEPNVPVPAKSPARPAQPDPDRATPFPLSSPVPP